MEVEQWLFLGLQLICFMPVAGNGFASSEYEDEGYERNRGYSRGAGRGRGRNFRNRFRGGYSNPSMEPLNDAEGHNQEAPRGLAR